MTNSLLPQITMLPRIAVFLITGNSFTPDQYVTARRRFIPDRRLFSHIAVLSMITMVAQVDSLYSSIAVLSQITMLPHIAV